MFISNDRWRKVALLGGVLIIWMGIVGYGPIAMAQEEEAAAQTEEEFDLEAAIAQAEERSFEEEITVTGSLIPRGDLTALSPVTVLDIEQELTYSGVSRIEDLVVTLPQVFSGQNSTIANGASGMATIDLRELGTSRTLVLVNGRRMAGGDAWQGTASYAPDINAIPAALVKRVDVLTGGASTVYGSDAVAGVVNFVMDTNFEGVRGGLQYSFFNHDNNNALAQRINQEAGFNAPSGTANDGDAVNAYVALGGKFGDEGDGHAVAYITYRKIHALTKGARDYVNCSVSDDTDGPACGGSSTIPQGRFLAYNADGSFNGDYILHLTNDGGDGFSFRERAGDVFNYGPFNHLQRPDEKYTAGTFAHYTINDHFEPYVEAMYTTNYTDAQIAPTGTFFNNFGINCDNPLMSDQQREILCTGAGYGPTDIAEVYIGKRNVEGNARSNALGHDNMRLVAGLRGDINDQWSYDFYFLHAQNNSTDVYNNDMSIVRMNNALDVIADPVTGQPVCRSGDGDGCAPYNLFQEGGITQEALDYITADIVMTGRVKTEVWNGTLTGDLEDYGWVFPSASEGIGLAVGAEYRYEWLANNPDEVYQFGGATGQGGGVPKVEASLFVKELFLETAIPIVQDAPGFRDFSLELGYRSSDYSTSGSFDTYKGLVNWSINDSWRIRGGYNRAVRAPNVWDLFQPARFGLGGSADICAGANPTATLEECMNTGVTAAQYGNILENPADQYNTLGGGNTELAPETADTVTGGLVWTPQNIAGLSLTLDYYKIDIEDTVGNLGADDIIQQCANTGDPILCGFINRDPQGTLWLTQAGYTDTATQNIGELGAEGIDLNFAYLVDLGGAGVLPIDLQGSYLMTDVFTNPLVSYDCVGYFGFQCGQAKPEWRHRARVTWESKFGMNLSLQWRYLGEVDVDDASSDPDIGDPDAMDNWRVNNIDKIKAYSWFDLTASYLTKNGLRFTVGINNVLDEEPPLAPTFNDDFGVNLYTVYDPLGRYVFGSLQWQF